MHLVEARGILSPMNGMNTYRGCTHGCIYCDSRSRCYQINHEFEDVEVKINAPALLERALLKKRSKCMIGTGSMSDPYLPLENELRITQKCLQLVLKHGFGMTLQTKSNQVLQDIDLLKEINRRTKCVIQMTLTTYDEDLCRLVEPNVCTTRSRFETLLRLREEGIPTVAWLSPILPFLNDTEENMRGILDYCAEAGVRGIICFGMGLTLRPGNREYFYAQLERHFPGVKQRYQKKYGNLYNIDSDRNALLMQIFHETCARYGIESDPRRVFEYLRQFESREESRQMPLL